MNRASDHNASKQYTISVIINTLNEEKNIARCLESVRWADEIIVVDMQSDDQTAEIARRYTDRVLSIGRAGYVEPARAFAISKAHGSWALIVDADEEIPPALATWIQDFVTSDEAQSYAAVELPRKNIIFGRWIAHTGWWPDAQRRLVRPDKIAWDKTIHTIPAIDGAVFTAATAPDLAIVHHNYQSVEQFVARMNRYTTIEAEGLVAAKRGWSWQRILFKPPKHVIQRFILQRGFRDGLHGLILSLLMGIYHFLVEVKLWELSRQSK